MIYTKPSSITLSITGIMNLTFIILVIIFKTKINNLNIGQLLIIYLLFIISIGIHGLLHLGMEINYNFNPINYFIKKN